MKLVSGLTTATCFALIACSGSGGDQAIFHPDVGPFDKNGDYVTALADAPVGKNTFARKKSERVKELKAPRVPKAQEPAVLSPPLIAAIPRQRVVPVPARVPAPVRLPAPIGFAAPVVIPAPVVLSAPTRLPAPGGVAGQGAVVIVSPPKPILIAAPAVVAPQPQKKTTTRHRVGGSDTLFGLSRKYGVSVGAIQRANGIRGTKIITGKTLVIPR